ncbi:MAG: hypothetical protein IPG68_01200 [Micrococcales bacterium]|nr:hypothetical protein [Micrococcales bacterium]
MRAGLAHEWVRVTAAIDGLLAEGRSGTLRERLNRRVQAQTLKGKLHRLEVEALRAYLAACQELERRLDAA